VADRLAGVRLGLDVVVFGVATGRHDEGGEIRTVFQNWFFDRRVVFWS
jgi:hypothetical protein